MAELFFPAYGILALIILVFVVRRQTEELRKPNGVRGTKWILYLTGCTLTTLMVIKAAFYYSEWAGIPWFHIIMFRVLVLGGFSTATLLLVMLYWKK